MEVGEEFISNNYGKFIITDYYDSRNVSVRFTDTGTEIVGVAAGDIRKGRIKDPMYISICGIGCIGVGTYPAKSLGKVTKAYYCWKNMINRCYNADRYPYHRYGGRGITVCVSWHNFQNYAKWYYSNYKKDFEIDKDLRIPDSKEYSEITCEFIPSSLNKMLITTNKARGNNPVGVSYDKIKNRYCARCCDGLGHQVNLGKYNTSEEAFQEYKIYKEAIIKGQAIKYYAKGDISEQIYKNLMEWVVVPYPE